MAVLFISDLHLSSVRPGINRAFFEFLRKRAAKASGLWILGDLFEYWVGDDDIPDEFNFQVTGALAECARAGTRIRVMHGNRDFLLGKVFAEAIGGEIVGDPVVLDLFGTKTVLTHGDALCIDDHDYMAFRALVRSETWQREFLAQPLAARKARFDAYRAQSEEKKGQKPAEIMDVNRGAVESLLREHGYPRLIHGHTHRPARHEHTVDGRVCERWVLPDWYASGGALACDERGCRTESV